MKMISTVKWFDAKKGFGFIHHPDGGPDIFVHYTSIESDSRFRTLHTDEPVTFELHDGPKGVHARGVTSSDPTWMPPEDADAPAARFQPPQPEIASLPAPSAPPDGLDVPRLAQPLS